MTEEPESAAPVVRFVRDGREETLACDWGIGCDGFRGISRTAFWAGLSRTYEHDCPYSWLGILADVPCSCEELVYARGEAGFALHSMRSPSASRLCLQVPNGTDPDEWPDGRIWDEPAARFAIDADRTPERGPVTAKAVTSMRSFVHGPMRHGRLLLAGDAAHIVPPTGAKGAQPRRLRHPGPGPRPHRVLRHRLGRPPRPLLGAEPQPAVAGYALLVRHD